MRQRDTGGAGMSTGPEHVKGHRMFVKQREFRFSWNIVCMEEMRLEKIGSHVATDCIFLRSFVLLKTFERHGRFVNCEVIGSNTYFKKLISGLPW